MAYQKCGDENIRKWLIALGAILIALGLILANSSNLPRKAVSSVLVASTTRESSVSANLEKDEKIVVEIRHGSDWGYGLLDPSDNPEIGFLYVDLIVFDPRHNSTRYWITFAAAVNNRATFGLWSIEIIRNDGGLNTESLYDESRGTFDGIGGVVMFSGLYEVNVTGTYPSRQTVPSYLAIFKGTILTVYPYTHFLPIGVVVGASGTVASLLGLRSKKRKIPKKKKSSHLSHHEARRR